MDNLIEQLTAKNSEYVHSVTKQLILLGKTDEEVKDILADILPKIIENQKAGVLARKLLGSPSEFVAQYETKKTQKATSQGNKNENPVLMWLDSALLFFGLITIMSGIMGVFSPKSPIYGLTMSIVTAVVAGLVMYLVYRFFYSQAGRPKWNWRSFAIVFAAIVLWMLATMGVGLLPRVLNPVLNPYVMLVLGVVAIAVRYLLKRQFNIQSAMVTQPRR